MAAPLKVAVVLGTRPEFIKFFSVLRELERQAVPFFVVHTGQHYSANLDQVFFEELGLPQPQYHLTIASLSPSEQIGYMVNELQRIFKDEKPSAVLVQGDTNTVMAGTLAGSKLGIPVGNIEAGLRSNNFSMAEEKNRILANQLATFLFVPTLEAYENLKREGFDEHKMYLVGNTIADAVEHFAPLADTKSDILARLQLAPYSYFLTTLHRAELTDSPENLRNTVEALNRLQHEHRRPIVFPMHPRTKKSIEAAGLTLDPHIRIIDPVGYFDFMALLKHCALVLTDSGGIQEEACILGRPTVTVRTETERPETVRAGCNRVVGYAPDAIIAGVADMLDTTSVGQHPYGSDCGRKIIEIIVGNVGSMNIKRILIVSDTYLPLVGGAELYTYNFARHLLNYGYEVTIITNTQSDAVDAYEEGVRVVRRAWPGWRNVAGVVSLYRELWRLTRSHDLAFCNYTYRMSFLEAFAATFARRPYIVLAHGLGTIIDKGFPRVYYLYRAISLWLSRGAISTSTEIADLTRAYTSHTAVLTAVDFSLIDRKIDTKTVGDLKERFAGKKILLTVRRLVPKNGIQYLISALPYLREMRDDFVYLALGGGRLEPILRDLVRRHGLEKHVVFEGELGNDKVFSYIAAADVEVFPSSAEAMSLACIEAMYVKTPVVASAIGGLAELIGTNEERGYLVDLFGRSESVYSAPDVDTIAPDRYKAFARQLERALTGAETSQKVAAAKRYAEEQFNWSKVTNDILRFTHESLNGRH